MLTPDPRRGYKTLFRTFMLGGGLASWLFAPAGSASELDQLPAAARKAGYTVNTFSSESDFSARTVDQQLSDASGFKWYNSNIVPQYGRQPENNLFNEDGSVTTFSPAAGLGLVTAANTQQAPGYIGKAFGGGGYFEAELKFDPAAVRLGEKQWPAFWAVSLESSASLAGQHWVGQEAGYNHTVEFDVFEFLYPFSQRTNVYGAAAHDFFGVYGKTCPPARCKIDSKNNERVVPLGTDWRQYHRYAMLWVPATAASRGLLQVYFDGLPIGSAIRWDRFTNQAPSLTASSALAFGEVDLQHLILILGAGKSAPITVRSVHVWQSSDANNLMR